MIAASIEMISRGGGVNRRVLWCVLPRRQTKDAPMTTAPNLVTVVDLAVVDLAGIFAGTEGGMTAARMDLIPLASWYRRWAGTSCSPQTGRLGNSWMAPRKVEPSDPQLYPALATFR
jgi:hypothetical protein